jgi:hypothetical protein
MPGTNPGDVKKTFELSFKCFSVLPWQPGLEILDKKTPVSQATLEFLA